MDNDIMLAIEELRDIKRNYFDIFAERKQIALDLGIKALQERERRLKLIAEYRKISIESIDDRQNYDEIIEALEACE